MQASIRKNLLDDFLSPLLYLFGCCSEAAFKKPQGHYRGIKFDVLQNSIVYRMPKDRSRRSTRPSLEGPVLLLHGPNVRPVKSEKDQIVDFLVELTSMVAFAQERDREGKTEEVIGVGKWWAEKPRWGGGTGKAIGEELDSSNLDSSTSASLRMNDFGEPLAKRTKRQGNDSTMDKPSLKRNQQKPKPQWDKRIRYEKVGKAWNEEWDDVSILCPGRSMAQPTASILYLLLRISSPSPFLTCPASPSTSIVISVD